MYEISHATFSAKTSLVKPLSFGGRQSSPPPYRPYAKFTKIVLNFAASGPLVKIIILLSVCSVSSLNTLELNIP